MSQGRQSGYDVRTRAITAVDRGMPMLEVAEAFDIDRTTLFRWVKRYHADGLTGLQRRPGSGRPRLLEDVNENSFRRLVLRPASFYGYETDLWTVGRLQRVIREQHGILISKNTVWRRLRDAGLTYQKPERQYFELDEEVR